ncbi:hypothetical protein PBI_JOHANN_23 [Microbacterium phage Johann]|uniref:Uncharacterized protein n=2 Tax=Goodmanvirus goodman TaxID=2734238 RepID=A0A3G3M0B1_9CAUD|nr:hypothetical protein HOU56_gp23 [Microbacterium phage Goodman]AYQ99479.1 hypothetical protein PBI_GOODMAN_23 [Microbacterium phage Goodman]AYQ99647.1 hypothetical protein PBI_JOHANN_23 [Microbacterium phage Johann]
MSYATVATIRRYYDLTNRVAACVAVEGLSIFPEQWASEKAWALAAQPGWAEAWESALVAHKDDEAYVPGLDPGVITDGMILSAVQALHAAPQAEESGVVESDPEEV